MIKRLLFSIMLISVAGCDFDFKYVRSFKWAAVDKYKIQNTVDDEFKDNNPYPEDINKDIESNVRERNLVKDQISELQSEGERKCKLSFLPSSNSTADPQKTFLISQGKVLAEKPQPEPIEDWQRVRKVENSPEYQDCLADIKKDPLIIDLKEKSGKLDAIYDAKRKHDDEVKKKLEATIESAIAVYAEKNGFDLIITNQSNGNVLYSKDKVVLDVTADVIDMLQKNMVATKQQSATP